MADTIEFRIVGRDQFSKSMKGVSASMATVQGKMRSMVNGIGSLRTALVGLAATAGGGMLAKSFVDAANTSEQLQTRLSVLLGSVEAGNELFQSMSEYASEVPFQFEEIMGAATQLSGVMQGGVKEIEQWMPLIGDLAAASGLSIQQTTEQVSRMYSAGAASADLFRERGITSMLGFQTGVSYSVEETRKMLMEAWEDPQSKFRDATVELASTWSGLLSMMADKWFQFRNTMMNAGIFDYMKALAVVINDYMADALNASGKEAAGMAEVVIGAMKSIIGAIGSVMDVWHGWKMLVDGFEILAIQMQVWWETAFWNIREAFTTFVNYMIEGKNLLISGFNNIASVVGAELIPEIEKIQKADYANSTLYELETQLNNAKIALGEMASELPSEAIQEFLDEVDVEFADLRNKTQQNAVLMGEDMAGAMATTNEMMASNLESRMEKIVEGNMTERELMATKYAEDLALLQESVANKLMTEDEYGKQVTLLAQKHNKKEIGLKEKYLQSKYMMSNQYLTNEQNLMASSFNQMLSIGGQYNKTAFNMAKAGNIANAITSTYAGAAKALEWGWPMGPVFAGAIIAAGLANVAQISSQSFSGQADAGMDYIPYSGTYMLSKGERVVKPEQNRDLTNFLNDGGSSGAVVIENMQIDILPNATNADALLELSDVDIKNFVADKIIDAMNALARQGIKPDYAG